MMRSTLALTLLAASLQPAPAIFRAEARVVVVQVTVHGRHGELVTGLDRRAFSVFENGRPQPIALFLRDAVPVSLGIVLDNSGSMQQRRAQVEAAALAFARASHPDDELFVVNFADQARIDVPLTGDRRVLEAGIARTDAIGGTAMRDAVGLALAYLDEHATRERKALLIISDGNDNTSLVTPARIHQQAEQTGIAVYAIGLPHDDPAKARRGRHDLDELTDGTGGIAAHLVRLEEIDATAQRLAQEIRTQYTLAYTPVNQALDGSYRKIRVAAQGPDRERLSVRTRTGYYATPGRSDVRPSAVVKSVTVSVDMSAHDIRDVVASQRLVEAAWLTTSSHAAGSPLRNADIRLTTAKKKPVDHPHIRMPVSASMAPTSLHRCGRTRSP